MLAGRHRSKEPKSHQILGYLILNNLKNYLLVAVIKCMQFPCLITVVEKVLYCRVLRRWLLNIFSMIPDGITSSFNKYAYDAFGTGIHSSYVISRVVNFSVAFRNKTVLRLSNKTVFHVLGCF